VRKRDGFEIEFNGELVGLSIAKISSDSVKIKFKGKSYIVGDGSNVLLDLDGDGKNDMRFYVDETHGSSRADVTLKAIEKWERDVEDGLGEVGTVASGSGDDGGVNESGTAVASPPSSPKSVQFPTTYALPNDVPTLGGNVVFNVPTVLGVLLALLFILLMFVYMHRHHHTGAGFRD